MYTNKTSFTRKQNEHNRCSLLPQSACVEKDSADEQWMGREARRVQKQRGVMRKAALAIVAMLVLFMATAQEGPRSLEKSLFHLLLIGLNEQQVVGTCFVSGKELDGTLVVVLSGRKHEGYLLWTIYRRCSPPPMPSLESPTEHR